MSATPLDVARGYLARGLSPVPVPFMAKGPTIAGWQRLRVTAETAAAYFDRAEQNVGVLTGPPSGGVVDVDLDCAEALALADRYLPRTASAFGRPSKRRSHRLYRIEGETTLRCEKYVDPGDGEMLLELRGDAHQTVFPGSTHETGEPITWDVDEEPAAGPEGRLRAAAGRLAAAALLLKCAPEKGRHDFLLLLSGALTRRLGAGEAVGFLTPLAAAMLAGRSGPAEARGEVERLVEGAAEKIEAKEKIPGWPRLIEAVGKRRVDAVSAWLGIRREPGAAGERPAMLVDPGNVEQNVAKAEKALAEAPYDRSIFLRGEAPVTVGFTPDEERIRDGRHDATLPKGMAVLRRAEDEHVLFAMERLFEVLRRDKGGGLVKADVPTKLAKIVLKNAGFRPVLRVVRVPTLRADGTVLEAPGYDPASTLIYAPRDSFPAVPGSPDRRDARAALERLGAPFRAFPFVADVDRAVVIAELLTILTRHLYAKAPGFVHRAAEAGTGKTLIADIAAIVGAGTPAANVSASVLDDPDEQRKLFTTWTLKGVPVGLIDNVPRGAIINSAEVNRFLTAELYGDRLLGTNTDLLASVVTVLVITGNQIEMKGDATRRMLIADLDAGVERPEAREFDFDAGEEARRDRAGLVVAALTLLRAYAVAGFPAVEGCGKPFGSFEGWSRWVRAPLVWAGATDPVAALEKTRNSDEERVALGDVIAGLHGRFREGRFTAKSVIEVAKDDAELRGTLLGVARAKTGDLSPERLGRYLRSNTGRVVGDHRLVRADDTAAKTSGYLIEIARPPVPGGSGWFRGVSNPTHASGESTNKGRDSRVDGTGVKNPPEPPGTPRAEAPEAVGLRDIPRRVVASADEARSAVAALAERRVPVGLDLETTGLDPLTDRARLLQLAPPDGPVLVIDLDRVGGLGPIREPLERLDAVAHNALFDMGFLRRAGVRLTLDCTLLAHHALTGEVEKLAALAERHLGLVLDKAEQRSDWSGEPTPEQLRYAALDAEAVRRLFPVLRQRLEGQGGFPVYRLMKGAQPAVLAMRLAGVAFDAPAQAELVRRLTAGRARLLGDLGRALAGRNPNSGAELTAWLAWVLGGEGSPGCAAWPKTGTGRALATGADAIRACAHLLPEEARRVALDLLLPYKVVEKQLSAFGAGLADHVHPGTGRIHAQFKLAATVAGRMACARPNLQQVPRDPAFRALFRAPEGRRLVIADYGQIELRVAALIAGEGKLLDAFAQGRDTHALTASMILGKRPEDVTKAERQLAKAVNFGLLYGQGAKGLQAYAANSYGVEITEIEARRHREAWFDAYPAFAKWHARSAREAKKTLSVRTPTGRVRRWATLDRKAPGGFRETEAYNTPVQGGAAEAMLAALAHLDRALATAGLDAVPVAVVHDELVLEAAEADAPAAARLLEESMEAGFLAIFPVATTKGLVEARIGLSWADK